jgi:serine/threonine protein kinase
MAVPQVSESKQEASLVLLGNYVLLRRLAVGGMAEVFVASAAHAAHNAHGGSDTRSKGHVAIKRILPSVAEDPDFIRMFIDEARLVRNLDHPNICPLYELGQAGATYYIVMEYVSGKDVLAIINRFRKLKKRMPPEMLAWIGIQVCQGLEYAHRKRNRQGEPLDIVHRDISPQNILVGYDGRVKVIDFGIAKAASRSAKTRAGVLKGKFGYMSPEQVQGVRVDHRSDLFSLGTCLYEMATCERLFRGDSEFETLEKVRAAQVVPLVERVAGFPPELDDVVRRALAPGPEARWQSAREFKESLRQFVLRHAPSFESTAMARWMRDAFADEMRQEQSALQEASYNVPSFLESARTARASHEDPHAISNEATYIVDTSSTFRNDDVVAQPTRIFFTSEDSSASSSRDVSLQASDPHAEPTVVHDSRHLPTVSVRHAATGPASTNHLSVPAGDLETRDEMSTWRSTVFAVWDVVATAVVVVSFGFLLWSVWK